MVQSHHLPELIDRTYGTTAHWARTTPDSVVVFVHGFFGKAVGTWNDFPSILLVDPAAAQSDLIFFGYDGREAQAANSAEELLEFLDVVASKPWTLSKGLGRSRRDPPYKRIVLVTHSLGGVIARRALLNAAKDGAAWIRLVRMVMFAPAHKGAHAAVLAAGFASEQDWYLGKVIAKVLKYRIPLIEDLKPDSDILKDLLDDTREALKANPTANHAVAHAVVWANQERVVINGRYGNDPKPTRLPKNHASVCKPDAAFVEPRDIVLSALV